MYATNVIHNRPTPADTWHLYNVASTLMQRHDVYTTSPQRRCNVMTLHRRWDDVVWTSCARWDLSLFVMSWPTLLLLAELTKWLIESTKQTVRLLCHQLWMKLVGHIALPSFVRPFVCSSVCHTFWCMLILRTLPARVSKFYVLVPHEKLADPYFFLSGNFVFLELCPFENNQNWVLSARYLKK